MTDSGITNRSNFELMQKSDLENNDSLEIEILNHFAEYPDLAYSYKAVIRFIRPHLLKEKDPVKMHIWLTRFDKAFTKLVNKKVLDYVYDMVNFNIYYIYNEHE